MGPSVVTAAGIVENIKAEDYSLEKWQKMYQHGKGAPRAFGATLTEVLSDLCRKLHLGIDQSDRVGLRQRDDAPVPLRIVSDVQGIPAHIRDARAAPARARIEAVRPSSAISSAAPQ